MTRKLFIRLNDATARLEKVISIAGALGDGAMADPLRDLLEEDEATLNKCFGNLPDWLIESLEDRDEAADSFCEWALETEHLGFVIQIATPVMTPICEKSFSYSWGYYNTKWLYADTFPAAVNAGMAWVKECRKKELEKAKLKVEASK